MAADRDRSNWSQCSQFFFFFQGFPFAPLLLLKAAEECAAARLTCFFFYFPCWVGKSIEPSNLFLTCIYTWRYRINERHSLLFVCHVWCAQLILYRLALFLSLISLKDDMRNAKLYRSGSVESSRTRIRSGSLGHGLHHVSWPLDCAIKKKLSGCIMFSL